MNDCFVSAVEDERNKELLVVRSRVRGDLERVIPGCKVFTTPTRDYLFRTFIEKEKFAKIVSERVLAIDYGNFKDSIEKSDTERSHAYMGVWTKMFYFQENVHGDEYQTNWQNYRYYKK